MAHCTFNQSMNKSIPEEENLQLRPQRKTDRRTKKLLSEFVSRPQNNLLSRCHFELDAPQQQIDEVKIPEASSEMAPTNQHHVQL